MKLSEVKGYKNQEGIYFFLKFSAKKYLEDIQRGLLYMNNYKYYINREEQDKRKGLGDKYEGSFVMRDLSLKIFDSETDEYIGSAIASQMSLKLNYLLYKPIFCTTFITAENLKIQDETDDEFIVSLDVNFLNRMSEDFGDYVLIINAYEFTTKLQNRLAEDKISHLGSKVKYSDYSINEKERFLSFGNKRWDMFFWKDSYFSYQQEHRLVILKDYRDDFIYDIGDISNHSELINTNNLKDFTCSVFKKKESGS